MKRSVFFTSLGAALLILPVLVRAQGPETQPNRTMRQRGPQGQAMKPRRDIKEELGLTEVQQADIRKATESAQRDRLRKTTDLKIASLDLRSLLRADKVDEKAVAAKVAEAQAAQGALLKLRVDTALAMKRILTPEQQKKFAEIREEQGRARAGQRTKMRGIMREKTGAMGPGLSGIGPGLDDNDDDLDSDLDLDLDEGFASLLLGEGR